MESRRPKDGPTALKNSFSTTKNSNTRIGISSNQLVILRFTEEQTIDGQVKTLFHGHVREWSELDRKMKNALISNKIYNERGEIVSG